jgi:lysozyme
MDWRPVITAAMAATGITTGGLLMVEHHEGTKLKAYPDVAYGWSMPTICTGHTKGVQRGDVATPELCKQYLQEDLSDALGFLTWSLPGVILTQGEVNGYTSLVFNLKRQSWLNSSVRKELLKPDGDRYAACLYAMRFNQANGKVFRGLVNRRYDEYNHCISYLPAPYLHERNPKNFQYNAPPKSSKSLWPSLFN